MENIQELFKETITKFIENVLEAKLDEELGYNRYDYKNRTRITVAMGTVARHCARVLKM